jgi:hypothetical protein
LEHAVKHQPHFGKATPAREALQTRILIADIFRVVQILDSDIAAEEEQARAFDRSKVGYPMLARMLAARRDNLTDTIAALEQRLPVSPGSVILRALPIAKTRSGPSRRAGCGGWDRSGNVRHPPFRRLLNLIIFCRQDSFGWASEETV